MTTFSNDAEADGRSASGSSRTRSLWSGILFGIGCVAFVDEAVFHQLLHWHHFYDKSTTAVGLVSDGLFHALSWFATVASLFMLADLRRKRSWFVARWWAGVLTGAGFFQLYDGIVQHKLMQLHQIRYGVDLTAYDWTWNIIAVILLAAGVVMVVRTRQTSGRSGEQAGRR